MELPETKGIVRLPAVAGRFYPASATELADDVARLIDRAGRRPQRAVAAMVPHAGYVYSGGVAGEVFASLEVPARVVILGPNHTGRGPRISVAARGAFRVPGGDVPIDEELADAILLEVPGAEPDALAHQGEHSIEVELPFLRARRPDVKIVPIVLAGLREHEAIAVGEGLARVAARAGEEIMVLASSDMSHYLPDGEARAADRLALTPLLAFDPAGLYRTVREHDISMCGVVPATAMLAYARARGAAPPELIAYATSAEAFGDHARVVGYAGVLLRAAR